MFCVFYFIKISKFALPGVMLIYERTSIDRKKERKTCANCVRGVLNGNGWDPFLCIQVDFYGDLSHHL